jgi:hypothetical protein
MTESLRAGVRGADRLQELLDRQTQVARRDQLRAAGLTWASVEAQLASRRWQGLGPLVVVTHNGPLTPMQQRWAAVLHCGSRSALAARTAAEASGLSGWEQPSVEVLLPRGTNHPSTLPGIHLVVHESRRFSEGDVHPTSLPRRTRIERSLIDAAAWSRNDRAACGILCAGVQQRLTTATRLLTQLQSAGRIKRGRLLTATLQDIEGGAHALSEIDFGALCRRHNLPISARQSVRVDRRGRRRYLDAELTGPDGRTVRVEIDGALHLLVRTYWDDMLRHNEFTIAGEPILRYPSVAIRIDEHTVVGQITRALGLPEPLALRPVSVRSGHSLISN